MRQNINPWAGNVIIEIIIILPLAYLAHMIAWAIEQIIENKF